MCYIPTKELKSLVEIMTKNEKIKRSILETHEKRKSQILKVFELKVDCHHTSKETFKKLADVFKQAKWVINDMIASENIFTYKYNDHRTVINFDKDKNKIERQIIMNTVLHQSIVNEVKQSVINISKSKKKGNKVGKLKFKSEVNRIPIRTGTIQIKSSKVVGISGFKRLSVYGLEQFINIPDYEVANANLVRRASGYYIMVTVFFPKNNTGKRIKNKSVGLDFGIKTSIVTSDGDFFDCNKQETEYLKYLMKQLHKKQKGSKRYWKLRNQIQKEYEHISNQKKDVANKIVAKLLKENDMIYFQDEQVANWKKKKHSEKLDNSNIKSKKKCGYSFGRQVQSSCLGRVKSKLELLEKQDKAFKISKWMPTTKFCPNCGCLNTLTLVDRTFVCDCGYSCDRDVHAARNVKLFGSIKRAECLEQASAEISAPTRKTVNQLFLQAESVKRKQETAKSLVRQ